MIEQNDAATGCPADPDSGSGYQVSFQWSNGIGTGGVVGYHVYCKHPGAAFPAVDWRVSTNRYLDRHCGGYVAAPYLNGWEWRVRAVGPNGELGPWSETQTFSFKPCVLGNGRACR